MKIITTIKPISSLRESWSRLLLIGLTVISVWIVSCSESNSPTEPAPSPGPLVTSFETSFGGTDNDIAADAVQARDGGYIVVGRTNSFNAAGFDIYIAKLNASGEKLWEKVYGTTTDDAAEAIVTAPDFGYVVAGKRGANAFLCKIDEIGNIVWLREYSGAGAQAARAVISSTGGRYALAGTAAPGGDKGVDLYVARTDSLGVLIWQKTYGGSADEQGNAIVETSDKGYAIAGLISTGDSTETDVYLVKIDTAGTGKWSRAYGGPQFDEAQSLAATTDGGYLITGSTRSISNSGCDILLVRTDPSGISVRQKVFGGQEDEYGCSMVAMADGGCLIAGSTESYGNGDKDVFVVRTDATDQLVWQKNFGKNGPDQGFGLITTRDNGFMVVGSTESDSTQSADVYVVKAGP